MSTLLYRNPNALVEERVEHLLSLMILDEKLAQLACLSNTAFESTSTFDPNVVAEQMPHGIGQVTRSRRVPAAGDCGHEGGSCIIIQTGLAFQEFFERLA